jgi:lysozyme family protein
MAYFQPALDKTLAHEGGFVNDPKDTGGMTFCGISRKAWPDWDGWGIVDKTLSLGISPLLVGLLMPRVVDFYSVNFWIPLGAERIESQEVANWLFDFAVNSGTTDAVKALQKIVNVKVDGIIGKSTITATNSTQIDKRKLQEARLMHYMACIAGNPELIRFGLGWVRRALA